MADVRKQAVVPSALAVLRADAIPVRQGVLFLQLRYFTAQVLDGLLQLLDHGHMFSLQTDRLQHGLLLRRHGEDGEKKQR